VILFFVMNTVSGNIEHSRNLEHVSVPMYPTESHTKRTPLSIENEDTVAFIECRHLRQSLEVFWGMGEGPVLSSTFENSFLSIRQHVMTALTSSFLTCPSVLTFEAFPPGDSLLINSLHNEAALRPYTSTEL
jgi:hypothetical protein